MNDLLLLCPSRFSGGARACRSFFGRHARAANDAAFAGTELRQSDGMSILLLLARHGANIKAEYMRARARMAAGTYAIAVVVGKKLKFSSGEQFIWSTDPARSMKNTVIYQSSLPVLGPHPPSTKGYDRNAKFGSYHATRLFMRLRKTAPAERRHSRLQFATPCNRVVSEAGQDQPHPRRACPAQEEARSDRRASLGHHQRATNAFTNSTLRRGSHHPQLHHHGRDRD